MNFLLQPEIQAYIRQHLDVLVSDWVLAQKKQPDFPIQAIAEQIACLQKAQRKLPTWFRTEGTLYQSLALEQCSSEKTAQFKSTLLCGESLADLSGGFGVDTYFFSQQFQRVYHIEPNEILQKIVQHNFHLLKVRNVNFYLQEAEFFLDNTSTISFDACYIDPYRRNNKAQKVVKIEDCEPNLIDLLPKIWMKTSLLLVKFSPLLDIEQGIRLLENVKKIWVISLENEVKELLFQLEKDFVGEPTIQAVCLFCNRDTQIVEFKKNEEQALSVLFSSPKSFIIEPFSAILKAGAFKTFAQQYQLFKLHPNSHLYTSDTLPTHIPARIFELKAISIYDKKTIHTLIPSGKANITTRNFPEKVAQIYQKLQLKEGGEDYILATTLQPNKSVLLVCKKVKND